MRCAAAQLAADARAAAARARQRRCPAAAANSKPDVWLVPTIAWELPADAGAAKRPETAARPAQASNPRVRSGNVWSVPTAWELPADAGVAAERPWTMANPTAVLPPCRTDGSATWTFPRATGPAACGVAPEFSYVAPSSTDLSILSVVRPRDAQSVQILRLIHCQKGVNAFERVRLFGYIRFKLMELNAHVASDDGQGLKRGLAEIARLQVFGKRTYLIADALLAAKSLFFPELASEVDLWLERLADCDGSPKGIPYIPQRSKWLLLPPSLLAEAAGERTPEKPMSTATIMMVLQETGYLSHMTISKQIVMEQCRLENDVAGMKMVLEEVVPQWLDDEIASCERYLRHVIHHGEYEKAVDFFLLGDVPGANREFQHRLRQELIKKDFYKSGDPKHLYVLGKRLLAARATPPQCSVEFIIGAMLEHSMNVSDTESLARLRWASALLAQRLGGITPPQRQAFEILVSRNGHVGNHSAVAELLLQMERAGHTPTREEYALAQLRAPSP